MAVVNDQNLTLADLTKRQDPTGNVAQLVELLTQDNAIVQDAVFKECNGIDGHLITARTGLPSVAARRYNQGVKASKSRTDQWTETCMMLSGLSKVDSALARRGGNVNQARMSEDRGFMLSMNNTSEQKFLYASSKSAPEDLMGLAPRFDATAGQAGAQVLKMDAAAAGQDQTSMWFIGWGDHTVYGLVPKGVPGGLQHRDMGEAMVDDGNGGEYPALRTWWEWQLGLGVENYQYICRLANIDTGNLSKTGDALLTAMIDAYYQVKEWKSVRGAIYCNRLLLKYLHHQARDSAKNGGQLSTEMVDGRPVTSFLGLPIRHTDAILNTEAPVV